MNTRVLYLKSRGKGDARECYCCVDEYDSVYKWCSWPEWRIYPPSGAIFLDAIEIRILIKDDHRDQIMKFVQSSAPFDVDLSECGPCDVCDGPCPLLHCGAGDGPMRTIIAGSRGIKDIALVRAAVDLAGFEISEVFSGGAQGVDQLGESVAYSRHIQVRTFPADWDKHGLSAGPIRNLEMAAAADALIAVWDGESRGTKHMIETAVKVGLRVFVLGPGEGVLPANDRRFQWLEPLHKQTNSGGQR